MSQLGRFRGRERERTGLTGREEKRFCLSSLNLAYLETLLGHRLWMGGTAPAFRQASCAGKMAGFIKWKLGKPTEEKEGSPAWMGWSGTPGLEEGGSLGDVFSFSSSSSGTLKENLLGNCCGDKGLLSAHFPFSWAGGGRIFMKPYLSPLLLEGRE